jgi:hypothetical protein
VRKKRKKREEGRRVGKNDKGKEDRKIKEKSRMKEGRRRVM